MVELKHNRVGWLSWVLRYLEPDEILSLRLLSKGHAQCHLEWKEEDKAVQQTVIGENHSQWLKYK